MLPISRNEVIALAALLLGGGVIIYLALGARASGWF